MWSQEAQEQNFNISKIVMIFSTVFNKDLVDFIVVYHSIVISTLKLLVLMITWSYFQRFDEISYHYCFERLKFCSRASCDHKKEIQVLLQVVQHGGGTRIAGYVHWNNQKYLEVAKTV